MHRAVHDTYQARRNQAFTIVELLIVVVVIAILAAIIIVAYNGISNQARSSALISSADQAGKKLATYVVANGNALPADLADFRTATGLQDEGDVTYQYTPNTAVSPNTYCITYTTGDFSSHVAGDSGGSIYQPTEGPCPGHTGTSPTTLADGSGCPTNYIVVPGSSLYGTRTFCVMKYEAKNVGGVAVSQADLTPWVNITQTNAIVRSQEACDGCHLITAAEWLTIAQNTIYVDDNWSGGSPGSGTMYRGHSDNDPSNARIASSDDMNGYYQTLNTGNDQRRTLYLSNGEVIWDIPGNVYEWVDAIAPGGAQPGASGAGWRNWNAITGTGSLSPNPFPAYAHPDAIGWDNTDNIGRVYSDSDESGARGYIGGGRWNGGSAAGVFSLNLSNNATTSANAYMGFRVAL